MKVLIDRNGLQVQYHLRDRLRLGVFITELLSASYLVAFSSQEGLTREGLSRFDVLVITTRSSVDYSQTESESIHNFVHNGGGLLLMSNHGDYGQLKDMRRFDVKLADRFGVTLERTFFRHSLQGERTVLSQSALNLNHPIIAGASGEGPVRSIVTNTCCSIVANEGEGLVSLSNEMVDKRSGSSPNGQFFAHALEIKSGLKTNHKGRIVTIADSGFIGTDCSAYPGPGLIGHGDNLRFIKNVIRWLGGELGS
jgi:hypothetical protein